ncbi:MAG: hypothetical protein AAFR44_04700 [Pseudomonadota bacterium]
MRLPMMTALLVVLTACAMEEPEVAVEAPPVQLLRGDCYTVELFDGFEIKPAPEGTPPEHAAFLGEWRFGAWDGEWCHDMIVTEITEDGQVILMDLHAPYEPWGKIATAFRRTARITEDGELHFRHGNTTREYRLQGGRLYGTREEAIEGLREVQLRRPEEVRLPISRPTVAAG